ncbi:uncharacterized protein LOC114534395 [Dendronephthya gigantea]|uniref:uncharacterized protein LOC114534395 n=1 Tax=Dendronephthya gigantea TaxID=151771 RepID=UPI00106D0907|nr:uncharacterized protein LOC114534395 [Dendronephthya gigantea]
MLFQSCILLQFFLFIASENPAMFQGVSRIKENVIAQFSESNSIFCELQCAVHRFCVAYNYKKKVDEKELNCQLTNTTEHKFDEDKVAKEEQEWTFYEINVDRSHFATCRKEVNECHNGGAMIWGPKKKFTCKCLKCYNSKRYIFQ